MGSRQLFCSPMSVLPNCVFASLLHLCCIASTRFHRMIAVVAVAPVCFRANPSSSPKSAPANLEMHKTVVAVIVFVGEMQYNCKRKSANGHWAEWTKRTIGLFLFVYSSTVPVWMADNWVVICSLYQLYYSCPQPDYGKVFVSSSESAAGGGQDFARQLRYFSAGGRHTNQAIKDECRVLRTEGREPL